MITTKEDIKRATEVMLAYAQGKNIQIQGPDGKWVDCIAPMFDWAIYDYRIKPQLTDIKPNHWQDIAHYKVKHCMPWPDLPTD